jgi:hypothetical protein
MALSHGEVKNPSRRKSEFYGRRGEWRRLRKAELSSDRFKLPCRLGGRRDHAR